MTVTLFCCLSACYALLSARRLKKVQRYRPLKPTRMYTSRENQDRLPKSQATSSNWNSPTSPQLIAPIIVSTSAV